MNIFDVENKLYSLSQTVQVQKIEWFPDYSLKIWQTILFGMFFCDAEKMMRLEKLIDGTEILNGSGEVLEHFESHCPGNGL